jgi:hypothetical protein
MIYALSTKDMDPKDARTWDSSILKPTKFEFQKIVIKLYKRPGMQ